MIYVVLGVGFSGTTLVSELLHHSGIRMIDVDDDNYDAGGKYEHPAFQAVNKALLGLADDQVRHLRPRHCPKALSPDQQESMRRLIANQQERYQDWGFKDPRTVVTYPLWKNLLPPHRLIAVYRDPAGNWPRHRWRGYRRRYVNGWRAFVHLRQWCEYNTAILNFGRPLGKDFLLLNYERLMQGDEELERLRRFTARPMVDRRDPAMYRVRNKGDLLFRGVRLLMDSCGPYSPDAVRKALEQERNRQLAQVTR
ncbi:O-antigen biosynthesis protein [Methylomarinovum tepidoasis]|uniref:O-antigen biosynthesis protein n=1 Tax=Methylomarinovum tepidoasis TaxID=2840183 RepID=A0AAU9C318_9GAMM|nr:sulfotransferase [Methylomarinovum sp. IN45]BCX87777.1 O-antigen biosynthesis protein [Methylomarinovum sp. IN45]